MHILFNMFALYSFGSILEAHWGGKRFINFYLITGLGALALQWAVQAFEVYQITGSVTNEISTIMALNNPTIEGIYGGPMVGASGAIFGLLVAFAVLYFVPKPTGFGQP